MDPIAEWLVGLTSDHSGPGSSHLVDKRRENKKIFLIIIYIFKLQFGLVGLTLDHSEVTLWIKEEEEKKKIYF